MDDLEFMEKFKPKERCIKDFKYWIVCIRESQTTLGSAVILLKRQTESVGNILKEEAAEFPSVINWYEKTCKEKFGAIKFNYLVMMMHDNFVHYHAFPRYDNDIKIFNESWHDEDWPMAIDFKKKKIIDENKLLEILNYMSN